MPPKKNATKVSTSDGKAPAGKETDAQSGSTAGGRLGKGNDVRREGGSESDEEAVVATSWESSLAVQKDTDEKIAKLEEQLKESDDKLKQSEVSRKQLKDLLKACRNTEDTGQTGKHGAQDSTAVTQEVKVVHRHSKTAFVSSASSAVCRSNVRGGPSRPATGAQVPPWRASNGSYRCYKCRKMGHRSFECDQKSNGSANAECAAKFRRPLTCYGCGKKGHIKAKCPSRGCAKDVASSDGIAKRTASGTSNSSDGPSMGTTMAFVSACTSKTSVEERVQGAVGRQCMAPILVNGVEVKALFVLGSRVNIISLACLKKVLRTGNASGKKLPAIVGSPPGVNLKDASGTPMKFAGLCHCVIETDPCDPGEEHKFLVQEKANYDVVLGTPVLLESRKWCERLKELLMEWRVKAGPRTTHGFNSSVFSMSVGAGLVPAEVVNSEFCLSKCKKKFEFVRRKSVVQIRVADVVQAVVDGRGLQTGKTAIVRGFNDFLFTSETHSGSTSRTGQKRRTSDVLATLNLSQEFFKCASSRAPARDVPFRGEGGGRQRACGCGNSNFGNRRRQEQ